MENKNLLLAILLSVGFLFFWSAVIVPRFTPPPLPTPPAQTPPSTEVAHKETELTPAHAPNDQAAPDQIARDIQNEIVFSPAGGAVRHWRLNLKGHEIDLVNAPDSERLPLATFPNQNFHIRAEPGRVDMETTLSNGVVFTKTLTLSTTGYLHRLSFRFKNPGAQALQLKDLQWGWGPGIGTAETERKENSRLTRALSMGKLNAHPLKPGDYPEAGRWAAIDNRYFLVAFIPPADAQPSVSVSGSKDQTHIELHQPVTIPAHGEAALDYQLYAGPKGYTQLRKYGLGLEEAVDFGFFSPVGKLILRAIYRLEGLTHNYGWAIVILTCILQILMLPLTIKSFKSALAMKQLQPQIAALQKTYKSDPKRLNIEMMNLYKKTGTNPFGGCLPMLLQLPIFWALFTTLRNAYELRGAPWIGWIHDLSAADPLHILPIIMGGAMFFQQRMTGASTDPTQKQMMMVMPIMFTVMFFNFPAGLVLYWLTNNLLTMSFQWAIQKQARSASTGA